MQQRLKNIIEIVRIVVQNYTPQNQEITIEGLTAKVGFLEQLNTTVAGRLVVKKRYDSYSER